LRPTRFSLPFLLSAIGALLLARSAAGPLLVARGFQGTYFANANWAPPAVSSRIDPRLSFGNNERISLPAQVPFSATWQGVVRVRQAMPQQTFYLRGKHATGELWVDGVQVVRLEPPDDEASWRAPWPAGTHRLTVRLAAAGETVSSFDAGFVTASGSKLPFDEDAVLTRSIPEWRVVIDRIVRPLSVVMTYALFVISAVAIIRVVALIAPPEEQ
jgi:hypothetical protein